MTTVIADDEAATAPAYAFKPSLMGAMCQFTLKPDALEWQIGGRNGRVRYDRVRAVRLSFRPVTMQSQRFITEIWSADNPKIQIVSASWRSMVEQERLDAPYAAFVGELHRRLAAAGGAALFSTGLPVAIYWVGVVVFAAVMLATAVMLVRAIGLEQWGASAIVGVFFAVFAYQLGNYFYRNPPGRYRPDALPAGVLPKS
ncbi:MAG: hypothetical protein QOF91_2190 [Alphaproteobacteria bacterium]|jgi:hypothetical protein|nr:hypothetical protein [Alphaproteobacteria bacterium]